MNRTFLGIVGASLLGQLAVLGYEMALTHRFGTTRGADGLAFGFMLAYALGNELAGWVNVLLVPSLLDAEARDGRDAATGLLGSTLAAAGLAGGALAVALASLGPGLWLLSDGTTGAETEVLQLFSPLVALLPMSAVLASALQARERYVMASLRQVMWYGTAALAILMAGRLFGPPVVPLGMLVGLAAYVLVLGLLARPFARRAMRSRWASVHRLAPELPPLTVMSAANYGLVLLERALAANLGAGRLAALTYAFRIVNGPITLIVMTASTMFFTAMSAKAAREGRHAVHELAGPALRLGIVLSLPAAALLVVSAEPIVRVLFERGAFTPESTRLTALAMVCYAPGLAGWTILQLLLRVHWALRHLRVLAAIQLGSAAFGAVSMLYLTWALGFPGLAIATSLTALVHAGALAVALHRGRAPAEARSVAHLTGQAILGSVAAAAVAAAPGLVVDHAIARLALGVPSGIAAYVAIMKRIAPADWRAVLRLLSRDAPWAFARRPG
ncbi:MAG: murein biosynthesis integral membrane protein MurJ [Candidatus Rokuibacteriota bacterium]